MPPIKVLAFVKLGGNKSIAAIRTIWPLIELNRRPDFDCVYFDGGQVQHMLAQDQARMFAGYDICVLSRMHGPTGGYNPFEFLSEGCKIVYETDDDLTDEYRDYGVGQWIGETVELCDAITTSTKHLARVMSRYGKPIYVCPNCIRTAFYAKVSRKAKRLDPSLTIGLVGTQTHWADWIMVVDALKKIKEKYPEVRIACGGYRPPYFKDIADMFFAPVQFEQYPAILRQIDIRLCPLDGEDKFNLSKSPIAALEAMAAARPLGDKIGGAIPVCSDHPVYRGTVDRYNGMMVRDGEWYETIAQLIEDEQLREKLSLGGHEWVKTQRDISVGAHHWAHAYEWIVGG